MLSQHDFRESVVGAVVGGEGLLALFDISCKSGLSVYWFVCLRMCA